MYWCRYFFILIIGISSCFLAQPSIGQNDGWFDPQVLLSRNPEGIQKLSSLVRGSDNSLHLVWISAASYPRSRIDTIVYMAIKNGTLYAPLFLIGSDTTVTRDTPQVVVDDDAWTHLFWIERKLMLEDSSYLYRVIRLALPIYSEQPHFGPMLADTLWSKTRDGQIDYLSATITKYNMIYVAWRGYYESTIWLTGKPKNPLNWTSPAVCPFSKFAMPYGNAMCPNLFTGRQDTLYLAFIGATDSETPFGYTGYTNFLHYSHKPLNSNLWIEPVFIWGNSKSASQQPLIVVDQQQVRHILWLELCDPTTSLFISNLFYTYSNNGRKWSAPRDLAKIPAFFGSHQMVVDSRGTLHIVWIQYCTVAGKPAGVYYTFGREDLWSEPQLIFERTSDKGYDEIRLVIDPQDRLHLIKGTGLGPPGGIYIRQIEYTWKDLYPTGVAGEPNQEERCLRDFVLVRSYPNPFNEATTISIAPQAECYASLQIYNINGQCVRSLLTDTLLKGETKFQWDGRNDQGVPLPSGVYYVQLKAYPLVQREPISIAGKIVLLK